MKKMKKVIITSVIALLSTVAMAQDRKVAIFDPVTEGNVDSSIKGIVREEISSVVVNTGGYTVLERQLIEKVLEENRFQMSGLVVVYRFYGASNIVTFFWVLEE